jgi:hypothetical protein
MFIVQALFYTFGPPLKFFRTLANGLGYKGDVINAGRFKKEDTAG